MGRPIKAKFFSLKTGSVDGDLQVTTASGDEVIIAQKGSSKYDVASGRVTLVDKTAGLLAGEASLQHEGKTVRKLTQYRAYYFDEIVESAVWRTGAGAVVGTFIPALAGEPVDPITATGTVVDNGEGGDANTVASVTIVEGGAGYGSAPVVTFSTGTGSTATGTAVLTGDAVTSITIDTAGSYLDAELPVTVTIAAP